MLIFYTQSAAAAPNYQMNYQGKLTNASNIAVTNGTYNMRFWLLTSPSIATTSAVWTESLTGTNKVTVTNGLFSIMLGSTTPLTGVNFNQTLYLGVEIGGTSTPAWDGEMSPRKTLGAVPAAFEAKNAETFANIATTSFLRADQVDTATSLLTFTGGVLSTASSTITDLTTLFATTTNLIVNGERFTDLTGSGLTNTANALTCATANSGTFGCLLAADWTIFNNKVSSSSIDTLAELETLQGSINIIQSTEIDTSSELATLLTDETGSVGGGLSVFSINPLLTGFRSSASSTIGDGTATGGLTVYGNSTTTGSAYFAGNVGVGTTTPGVKLDINGEARVVATASTYIGFTSISTANNTGAGVSMQIAGITGANLNRWISEIRPADLGGGGANSYYLLGAKADDSTASIPIVAKTDGTVILGGLSGQGSTGNVGIGTTNPIGKFNVKTGTDQELFVTNGTAYGAADGISLVSVNDANNAYKDFAIAGKNIILNAAGGTSNVGIGTTAPNTKLQVVNSSATGSVPAAGTYGATAIFGADNNLYGLNIGSITNGNGYIQQQRGDSAVTYSLLLQPNGGNVGIGTAAPTLGKLQVNNNTDATNSFFQIGANSGGSAEGVIINDDRGFAGVNSGTSFVVRTRNDGINDTGAIANFTTTGGSETSRLWVGIAGNVGIGTAAPGAKLQIDDSSSTTTYPLTLNNPSAGILIAASGMNFAAHGRNFARILGSQQSDNSFSNGTLGFYAEVGDAMPATPQMFIQGSSGNVGIGTASPTNARLRVEGGGIITTGDVTTDSVASVSLAHTGTLAKLETWNSTPLAIRTAGVERMRIDTSGNVGIGTTNPRSVLEAGGAGTLRLANLTANSGYNGWVLSQNASAHFDLSYPGAAQNVLFAKYDTGNVGIGTTNPGAKLQISAGDSSYALIGPGTTYATTLRVGYYTPTLPAATGQVAISSGNIHIDAAPGAFTTYLNFFSGTGGVVFGNGATGGSASVSAAGAYTGTSLNLASGAITSGLINGQTISSAANFTGTLTTAGNITMNSGGMLLPSARYSDQVGGPSADFFRMTTMNPRVISMSGGSDGSLNIQTNYYLDASNNPIRGDGNISTAGTSFNYDGSIWHKTAGGGAGTISWANNYALIDSSQNLNVIGQGRFTGSVGIGTTGPSNPLHVVSGAVNTTGDSLTTATAQVTGPNVVGNGLSNATFIVATNDAPAIDVGGSIGFAGRYVGTQQFTAAQIRGAKEDGVAGNYGGYLAFGTRANGTQISEKMRITGAGNVGIGTTNPRHPLQVYGTLKVGGAGNDQTGVIVLGDDTTTGTYNGLYRGGIGTLGNANWLNIGGYDGVNITTGNAAFGSQTSRLTIVNSTGNVGIGTTGPAGIFTVVADKAYNDGNGFRVQAATGQTSNLLFAGPSSAGDYASIQSYKEGASAGARSLLLNPMGGSVGIGTTNPTGYLDGVTGQTIYGTNAGLSLANASGHYLQYMVGNELRWFNGGADKMVLLNNGNLGIGTAGPNAKLSLSTTGTELGGTAASNGLRTFAGVMATTPGTELAMASIGFDSGTSNNTSLGIRALRTTSGSSWLSTAIGLGMDVDNTIRAGASLWLNANSNVGIGTAVPLGKLHVSQTDATTGALFNGTTKAIRFGFFSGYSTIDGVDNTGTGSYQPLQLTASTLTFGTSGFGGAMKIANNGYVGIGTTDPGYKLTVNGEPGANGYTAFTNYSDSRLKDNITSLITDESSALSKISALRPVTFNYNSLTGYDEATQARRTSGFIAQELQTVFPEMVGTIVIGGTQYFDTNLSDLPLYTVMAVQELHTMHLQSSSTLSNFITTTNANFAQVSSLIITLAGELETTFATASSSIASLYTLINATKEQQGILDQLITASSSTISLHEGDTFWSRLTTLVNSFVDGVLTLTGVRTKELCLQDNSGETCVTKSQLDALLQNSNTAAINSSYGEPSVNQEGTASGAVSETIATSTTSEVTPVEEVPLVETVPTEAPSSSGVESVTAPLSEDPVTIPSGEAVALPVETL